MQPYESNDRPVSSYVHRAAAYFTNTNDRNALSSNAYQYQLVPSANNADKTSVASLAGSLQNLQSLSSTSTHSFDSHLLNQPAAVERVELAARSEETATSRNDQANVVRKQYLTSDATANGQAQSANRPRGLEQIRKAHSIHNDHVHSVPTSIASSVGQVRQGSVNRLHRAGVLKSAAESEKHVRLAKNVSGRDSQTETELLQRLLKQAREQNVSLLDQKLRVERQFGQFLEESNQKFAQMSKLCDTLSTLVAHYEPLVSEQQTEIAKLRTQLDEESRLLAHALKERQQYELANKNIELRLDNLHQALRNERRQVADALKRVQQDASQTAHSASLVSSPSDVQLKYEQAVLRITDLETQLQLVSTSVTEVKSRHQRFLVKTLFSTRRESTDPMTVEFSDQLDALLLPNCVSKVHVRLNNPHVVSTSKQLIVTSARDVAHDHDCDNTPLRLCDTVFTGAQQEAVKFYRLASCFSLPIPVQSVRRSEQFLFRSLRAALKISEPVVQLRAHVVLRSDASARPASLRALSLRSEFAKSRNTMMSLKKTSISEEMRGHEDDDGGYDSPQTHSQILCVPDAPGSAQQDAGGQKMLESDSRPPTVDKAVSCDEFVRMQFNCSAPELDATYEAPPHIDSYDDFLKNGEHLQVPKLLSEIEQVPTYDQVAASLFRLSDTEVEERFALAASRFKLDRPTLVRRAHLCEHQHSMADYNLHKSLQETRRNLNSSLKTLGEQNGGNRCRACDAAAKTGGYAKKSLTLLEKCITRFAARSEQLGAVQEELRTSNACEVMIGCFETLRLAHGHTLKELDDAKKQIDTFENEYRIMQHKRASLSALPRADELVVGRRQRARRFKTMSSFNEAWVETKSPWSNVSASLGVVNFLRSIAPRERDDDTQAVVSFNGRSSLDNKPIAENEESDSSTVWLKNQAVQCDEKAIIYETALKQVAHAATYASWSSQHDCLIKFVLYVSAVAAILFFLYFAFVETNLPLGAH